MKVKITSNKQKAKSLKTMAELTLQRLREIDALKYPSNTLTDHYDIIHKLMESLTNLEGIKIKGEGAHQELIDYICSKYKFSEADRIFLQELREFRNRINYEGFFVKETYVKLNKYKIELIIQKLLSLIKLD